MISGFSIVNYMKSKTESGMTGRMVFDDDGRRTHFYIEITELSKDGFKVIGTWDPDSGVKYTRSTDELMNQVVESLQKKVVIVASRLGAPFLALK
jgi:ionotropic glutamate receptor